MSEHEHYWIVTVDDGVECCTCYQTMDYDEAERLLNRQCVTCEQPVSGTCEDCQERLIDRLMWVSSSDSRLVEHRPSDAG